MKHIVHFIILFVAVSLSVGNIAYALKGPTWLFTVPTADTLEESEFTVGFIHADIGFTNELQLGIRGIKLNLDKHIRKHADIAVGVSFFEIAYLVTSHRRLKDDTKLHLGIKASPTFLFAAAEFPLSHKNMLIVELNDGFNIGIRSRIKPLLKIDVGVSYGNLRLYQRKFYEDFPGGYYRIDRHDFRFSPIIGVAYSDVF